MKKTRRIKIFKEFFIQLIYVSIGILIIFPILYALSVSFMENKDVLTKPINLLPPSATLDNYSIALTRTPLLRYLLNSTIVSLISTISRIIMGSMAAYAFSFYEFRGKKALFALAMATMMIPPDVLIIANYGTISKLGLINTYFGMCSIFLVSANNIFLLRQNFLSYSTSLRDAAYIDGCGTIRFFTKILIPTSSPILFTLFISSFVSVWNQYVWPMLVTKENEMRTVQVGVAMLKDRESSIFAPIMAAVIIALLPTLIIFILFQRKIVAGMMDGSVKA